MATGSSAEELGKLVATDLQRWGSVADTAKIKKNN